MLKNYVVVALRSFRRRKVYAFINVFGLAVGMACCLLIALYVRQELRYDAFHEKGDRLYRVVRDYTEEGETSHSSSTMPVLVPTLEAEVPEVEAAVRVSDNDGDQLLRYADRSFDVTRVLTVDAAFFRVFSFRLLRGDPATALTAPGSLVLTASVARRLFGDDDPLGKVVVANNAEELTVTGVVEDVPAASHLQFNALLAFSSWERDVEAQGGNALTNWFYVNLYTYVLLAPQATPAAAEAQVASVVDRHMGEALREIGATTRLGLEPLADVRLRSAYGGMGATGRLQTMYVFALVAAFILLVACVNFTNLATARSAERAKEVGVRKSVGARRSALALQFVGEAVLLAALAFVLALALAQAALPLFERLAGGPLAWALEEADYLVMAAAVLGVGLLAGFYPAVVLSRFDPVRVLKGAAHAAGRRDRLRKGLVVAQFTIALALIAATAIVFRQLDYMQRQDLGFDMDRAGELLVVDLPRDGSLGGRGHLEAVKARLQAHPDVLGVSASANVPGDESYYGAGGELEREDGAMARFSFRLYPVDASFPDVFGLTLLAGRTFSAARAADSTAAFLLNETAVREAGFTSPEAAVGRRLDFWGVQGEVVGVVRDFHASGLQYAVGSVVVGMQPRIRTLLTLRVRPGDVRQTLAGLEAIWKEVAPAWPFAYRFLDERFDAQYASEVRFGRLFGTFAFLAILIACLGLFGLAAFTVEQRTKEIGIRKILGASTGGLVLLLTKDLVGLVAVALVGAVPLAYLPMQHWLEDFAYRTEIGAGVFVLAGATVLAVALLTAGLQAARAATRNPVHALRSE